MANIEFHTCAMYLFFKIGFVICIFIIILNKEILYDIYHKVNKDNENFFEKII